MAFAKRLPDLIFQNTFLWSLRSSSVKRFQFDRSQTSTDWKKVEKRRNRIFPECNRPIHFKLFKLINFAGKGGKLTVDSRERDWTSWNVFKSVLSRSKWKEKSKKGLHFLDGLKRVKNADKFLTIFLEIDFKVQSWWIFLAKKTVFDVTSNEWMRASERESVCVCVCVREREKERAEGDRKCFDQR